MEARTLRQLVLLGALLAVLAGLLWWNIGSMTGSGVPAAATRQAARGGPAPAGGTAPPVEDVALESLEASQPEPGDSDRNPFRFGGRQSAAAEGPAAGPVASGVPSGPGPLAAPPPAGPPPMPVRFFGIVEDHGRKLAALTDGRGNVFYGSEGDIIEGRYRIVRIGVESIELAWVDGRGQQTIRLSGS
jgi:hypothetical protein